MINVVAKNIKLTPACFHFQYFKLKSGKLPSKDQLNERQRVIHISFCHDGICSKKSKKLSKLKKLGFYKPT